MRGKSVGGKISKYYPTNNGHFKLDRTKVISISAKVTQRVKFLTSRDKIYFLVGVGVSDLLKEINGGSSKDLSKVLIGDGMIIFAQIIVAAQMVIEEKFVNGKNIHPLRFGIKYFRKIRLTSGI